MVAGGSHLHIGAPVKTAELDIARSNPGLPKSGIYAAEDNTYELKIR